MMNSRNIKLNESFYQRADVLEVAKDLLGKVLITEITGQRSAGMIVETEAYSYKEKACHAYMNRNTKRTKVLFENGGTSYVYLCYGIHKLFNVVTNVSGVAEAVLVRAVQPLLGEEMMVERRGTKRLRYDLTSGPGKLTSALGISMEHNQASLMGDSIWIENWNIEHEEVVTSPRIGVAYAEEDALLPWRFNIADNPWVSKGINNYHQLT